MSTITLDDQLRDHGLWRESLTHAVNRYEAWLARNESVSASHSERIRDLREALRSDRLMVAFVAEFSRGKTELINALFFADTGVRLLPSSPGRTTMCPTEIYYDPAEGSYIRLLPIETRLSNASLMDLKQDAAQWTQIELDPTSPMQMQEAFHSLSATKQVMREEAEALGLFSADLHARDEFPPEYVDVPCWRHALISFPHDLLRQGLVIIDTPGLNALGTEPELTVSLLPRAQVVIFVLAADTGVTKSDLEIWRLHVKGLRPSHAMGTSVVLNKIDSIWDDLKGSRAVEESIHAQIESTSRILDVSESLIFPVSAKQALLGKVKGDDALLAKAQLCALENHLAETLVNGRQKILADVVLCDLHRMIEQSSGTFSERVDGLERQLAELRRSDLKNQDVVRQLTQATREEHTRYLAFVESLQTSMRAFSAQAKMLSDTVAPDRIEEIIARTRKEMSSSLTTIGMKAAMKGVLNELSEVLQGSIKETEEVRTFAKTLFSKLALELRLNDLKLADLSLTKYYEELEGIIEQGETFRCSSSSTLLEQSIVVNKLYGTLIARAQVLFQVAHNEVTHWASTAFSVMVEHIRERKRFIENRMDLLRKVNESGHSLGNDIAELERELAPLQIQYREIQAIRESIPVPAPAGQSSSMASTVPVRKAAAY